MTHIPSLHLDTQDLPNAVRLDVFRASLPTYRISAPHANSDTPFWAKVDAWMVGDLVVTRGSTAPIHFVRSRDMIEADGQSHYSFLLLTEGSWTGDMDGMSLTVGTGEVAAVDMTRPFTADATQNRSVTLKIARATLDAAIPDMPYLHGLELDGAPGRILADHLMALVEFLPRAAIDDIPSIASGSVALIASCLSALPERTPFGTTKEEHETLHRIKRYVNDHLTQRRLSPNLICSELSISRSTLYRSFLAHGGIARYIVDRRLQAAHTRLWLNSEQKQIATIAFDLGFASPSHFSSAFRERFGFSPSEVRQNASARQYGIPEGTDPRFYNDWLRRLATLD